MKITEVANHPGGASLLMWSSRHCSGDALVGGSARGALAATFIQAEGSSFRSHLETGGEGAADTSGGEGAAATARASCDPD